MSESIAKMALALGDVERELIRQREAAAVEAEPSDDFRDIFDDPEDMDDDDLFDDEDDDSEDD